MEKDNWCVSEIKKVSKGDKHFLIEHKDGEKSRIYILNNHVFRYYVSTTGNFIEHPEPNDPTHTAKINSKQMGEYNKKHFEDSYFKCKESSIIIYTEDIEINFDKNDCTLTVIDKRTKKDILKEVKPLSFKNGKIYQTLSQLENEYFYGGGMQNGKFSHKGEIIEILNTNEWTDGGVASPCPFYWSSNGYGVLRNTWKPGTYDFSVANFLITEHDGCTDFDAFYFINKEPKGILSDYFELTGQPIFLPEYALYEAHLNAFNRDYWVEVDKDTNGAILFEDGKYYKSFHPKDLDGKEGVLESLNGENNNYQFSARAMIDRYVRYDMPLGWFVPNDGYGSGYGQSDSLDGDIANLKDFVDYAHTKGIEVGVWTESKLQPNDPENPQKGDRDLTKEIKVAGVVALKADVAWIGSGYSFGLSAIENASKTLLEASNHLLRPMIIMVDGWAGTQRCAGIWSGDQIGGEWEYIRFHIPTYIGTGLSGQPNIGSDMDGIFGGKDKKVNIRDFQWKAFTPIQLNMDGWGRLPKTPFGTDEQVTKLNRAYLKLKSMLMPYNYSIAYESTHGLPMVRAMFLEFPKENRAYTKDSQYQFMWGPNLLIAPIYDGVEFENGESHRNGIYLPDSDQLWIDFFTGQKYQGGVILNDMRVPLWKIPIFIKDGAIIPMTKSNNNPKEIIRSHRIFNIYPNGKSFYEMYEDDGISTAYAKGETAKTKILVDAPTYGKKDNIYITIRKTQGIYKNMVKERITEFRILSENKVDKIKLTVNGYKIKLQRAESKEEYLSSVNASFYDTSFQINEYLEEFLTGTQKCILVKCGPIDVTTNDVKLKISNYLNECMVIGKDTSSKLSKAGKCSKHNEHEDESSI